MKKIFLILSVLVLIAAAAIYLFGRGIKAANQAVSDLCDQYKVGQKIDFDAELLRIKKLGLIADVSLAGEAGHDTRMILITAPGFEPSSCEVKVRDTVIFSVR